MSAPGEIHRLVERFDRNLDAYRSGAYKETQVRREFVDPFFVALGWDGISRPAFATGFVLDAAVRRA